VRIVENPRQARVSLSGGSRKVSNMNREEEKVIEQAIITGINLGYYWLSQGKPRQFAIRKAMEQTLLMVASSGISLNKLHEKLGKPEEICKKYKEIYESEEEKDSQFFREF